MLFAVVGLGGASLLRRSRDDADAFAEFYEAYSDRVLRFVGRRVLDGEIALDLTAETFAKALQRRRQFRGDTPGEEQAWLFSIAASELSHFWRRGKVEQRALRAVGVGVPSLTDVELERIEERAGVQAVAGALREEMDQLPEAQRDAVRLRVVDDLSYDEVAQHTGVTAQVARARVSRGLRTLAAELGGRGIELEDVA